MTQANLKQNNRLRYTVYALFLYATLIVDFYRKFIAHVLPLSLGVETFRNLVYVVMFGAFLLTVRYKEDYFRMIFLAVGFGLLTMFSWLLNMERGAGSAYIDLIFMFFSRLMPAFYIGKFLVGHEQEMFEAVRRLRLLVLLYVGLIALYPETSEASYITISGNLLIPSLLLLFSGAVGSWRFADMLIGIAGCAVILIYGGRGSLVSVFLVLFFVFLVRLRDKRRKYTALLSLFLMVVLLLVFYENIIDGLVSLFPESRTLRLIANGDFMWTSNRDGYYAAGWESLLNHPLRMYGFLGDRFYFADTFSSGTSLSLVLTMFSHNVLLEILLNFGLFIGAIIITWLLVKFYGGFKTLFRSQDLIVKKWHLIIFGSAIVTLLVSTSYLNDYTAWLIAGSFFTLATQQKAGKGFA